MDKALKSSSKEFDKIHLLDILITLTKNIKLIIFPGAIFGIISSFYVFFIAEPIYTSSSKIMSSSGGGVPDAFGIAARMGFDIPINESGPKWVYPEIITSRTLAKKVLRQKFDTEKFGPQKQLIAILSNSPRENKLSQNKLEIITTSQLQSMIKVNENLQTGILSLKVEANEASLAQQVNEKIIQELDAHQRDYNKSKTTETKRFILDRIRNTENELIVAEEKLKDFRDRNRRIENSPALQLEQQRLAREVTVLTGVYTTLKQQLETTKIEEVRDSDYVVILDEPSFPLNKTRPKRLFVIIFSTIIGSVFGIILLFIKESLKDEKEYIGKKLSEAKTNILNYSKVF